jgi:uncharacterized protein with NAD-binding domain and iron-sulfur cluster
MSRKKVAIVGGGPSALACAFHLTSTPELRERHEITLYQMGWRLGGKAASGRDRENHDRITEHGLHILFGFYQNTLRMLREAYAELGRRPGEPLATIAEALTPHGFAVLADHWKGAWAPNAFTLGRNRATTGDGPMLGSAAAYASMFAEDLVGLLVGADAMNDYHGVAYSEARWRTSPPHSKESHPGALVRTAVATLRRVIEILYDASQPAEQGASRALPLLEELRALAWSGALGPLSGRSRALYRLFTAVDFATSLLTGVVRDGALLEGGFDRLDRLDFRDWLAKHGASPETLGSSYVLFVYDCAFCYQDGDTDLPRCGAGTAVRTLMRFVLTYKGAFYYKMNGGMGDVFIAPLYLVLKRRGVRFAFFHKATRLVLSGDERSIAHVELDQQVELEGGDPLAYDPLFDCKGLPSWPDAPRYEQIAGREARRLREERVDLESYYSTWKGKARRISAGTDYDTLVLGTPIGTIPFLCQDLLDPARSTAAAARWRNMVEKVQSVATVSLQIWVARDVREMGWRLPSPLLTTFVNPLSTWSDMSQVIPTEGWPAGRVRDVSYFTGPQRGPTHCPSPADDPDFERRHNAEAYEHSLRFMKENITTLLPGAVDPRSPPSFDFDLLVAPEGAPRGPERLRTQYWRSNCGPSDRCTLPLPDTNQYRLKAGDTGYENLVVTGDWIDNGFYIACFEGAVMGGIHAARAVSGVRFPIVGEAFHRVAPPEAPPRAPADRLPPGLAPDER